MPRQSHRLHAHEQTSPARRTIGIRSHHFVDPSSTLPFHFGRLPCPFPARTKVAAGRRARRDRSGRGEWPLGRQSSSSNPWLAGSTLIRAPPHPGRLVASPPPPTLLLHLPRRLDLPSGPRPWPPPRPNDAQLVADADTDADAAVTRSKLAGQHLDRPRVPRTAVPTAARQCDARNFRDDSSTSHAHAARHHRPRRPARVCA
ncbi:hypothetical protein RJ55_01325 [Drechmeria coniospora]|nr:hypothetical protein RJ55_01325 [Drechmeria coniospora]